ncbi:MAG: type I methionyl aminopeptidase [Deltaproteobacteria bacterium]|nr:type I methionyl aminopeptidase [Deltaproteobacteria bacterium]
MHYHPIILKDDTSPTATGATRPAVLPGTNENCWCGSGKKYKRCHRDLDRGEEVKGPVRLRPGIVSSKRFVPPEIPRPDYAESTRPGYSNLPEIKDAERIVRMRRACRAAGEILKEASALVAPGITTDAIDAFVHEATLRRGGYPSPLNYRGFPKSVCTSVNEVICHGIPDSRPLEDGDIVNLDVTIFLDGMHGDTSATYSVGNVDESSRKLVEVARECLYRGIEAVKPGGQVRDIGNAIEAKVRAHGYNVVRTYCGHGIGETFHTRMQIPHYYDRKATRVFEPGMTFTIEPMINLGGWQDALWDDGWTVVTADGKRSAQFEHTLLVTDTGVDILTQLA